MSRLQGVRPLTSIPISRFTFKEILLLAGILHIPDPFITGSGSSFTAVEALGLLLLRMRSNRNLYDFVQNYDRSLTAISEIVNELLSFLEARWSHLLGFDTSGILHPNHLRLYADAVYDASAPLNTVWGFINCTLRRVCCPTHYQGAVYSGYKKYHALKYQAVVLPNGMFGHLFGPIEGRHNDGWLLQESGILDWCRKHAYAMTSDGHQRPLQIFGDPAYGVSEQILSPFSGVGGQTPEEQAWNTDMSRVQIEVEHTFGVLMNMWPAVSAWWKHKIFWMQPGTLYRVAVLLTNAHNCIHPNQISRSFELDPPSVEEYFHD